MTDQATAPLHLASSRKLGNSLIVEGVAKAFPYLRGWVAENVMVIGKDVAAELFRRNCEALRAGWRA